MINVRCAIKSGSSKLILTAFIIGNTTIAAIKNKNKAQNINITHIQNISDNNSKRLNQKWVVITIIELFLVEVIKVVFIF